MFSVFAEVDIFPGDLKAIATAKLKYINHTDQPMERILLNFPDEKWEIAFSKPATVEKDDRLRFAIFTLETPLGPGEQIEADYRVEIDDSTIENDSNIGDIHYNGTFFSNTSYFPNLGYLPRRELSKSKVREKY
ncbi:MAG: hypothetical protein GY765_01710, partial [bacterium]|nr:hypothetical protein [bacterium]